MTSTEENKPALTLTSAAASEVMEIFKQNNFDPKTAYLRVAVKGGGCQGFSYALDITETSRENDEVFEQNGVRMICDSRSLLYLTGTIIDFKTDIMANGFTFANPNATSSCGCKKSFSA